MTGALGADFLAGFHAAHAAVTEDLLAVASDSAGRSPYAWLVEQLPQQGTVLDLACGSAPVADVVGADRYLGVDRSAAELGEARRRRPAARVVAGDVATVEPPGPPGQTAAVTVAMALMLLDLPAVLTRAARWLVPGGTLAAIVPVREAHLLAGTPYGELAALLGVVGVPYPEPLDAATLPARAGAAGFVVTGDELSWFARPLASEADLETVARSFYVADDGLRAAAAWRWLQARQGSDLPYPIRRVTFRRSRTSHRCSDS